MPNFLFVYRSEPFDPSKVSPEDMQKSMDRWTKWIGQGFTEGWLAGCGRCSLARDTVSSTASSW